MWTNKSVRRSPLLVLWACAALCCTVGVVCALHLPNIPSGALSNAANIAAEIQQLLTSVQGGVKLTDEQKEKLTKIAASGTLAAATAAQRILDLSAAIGATVAPTAKPSSNAAKAVVEQLKAMLAQIRSGKKLTVVQRVILTKLASSKTEAAKPAQTILDLDTLVAQVTNELRTALAQVLGGAKLTAEQRTKLQKLAASATKAAQPAKRILELDAGIATVVTTTRKALRFV